MTVAMNIEARPENAPPPIGIVDKKYRLFAFD